MSQDGFKRLSTVATWANSLAFVVLTSDIAASENLPPVPAAYQSSATCDQGTPGGEFVVGAYKYRLSSEIFPPSVDLSHKIQGIYGRDTELADWDDLKSKLNDVKTRHDFVRAIGMPLQSQNFECGNALISKGGSVKLNAMNYFVARHDGAKLKNWFIVDSIGQDELHLGRWNHYGRALIKTKADETKPPVLAAPAPPTTPPNPSASLGRRVALVIGNADYKNAALINPTFDADLVSESLRRSGFEVTEFKADKSAGLVRIDADFTLKVWVRGQRKAGAIHVIPMTIALVRGPDKMWYLEDGTLGREVRTARTTTQPHP